LISSVLIHFTRNVFIKKANSIEKHTPFLFENKFIAAQTHNPEVNTENDDAVVSRLVLSCSAGQDESTIPVLSCHSAGRRSGAAKDRTEKAVLCSSLS